MTKREAREFMMTVLYRMDLVGGIDSDRHDEFFQDVQLGTHKKYCEELFSLACNKIAEIDAAITRHSQRWSINRIPKTDLAVLRLAVCEILFMKRIPDSVAVNEAVELAHRYGEENSPSYINGILGSIVREKNDD